MIDPNYEVMRSALHLSRRIARERVRPGDIAVDATCGRGLDTLLLARLVGGEGRVYAFDIQKEAVDSTLSTLMKENLQDRVAIIKDDHRHINHYIDKAPAFCMFNLGYLPGGDHSVITRAETSVAALQDVIDILAPGGTVTLVCYPGHPGGLEELDALRSYLAGIPQQYLEVIELSFINQINSPAHLLVVYKLKEVACEICPPFCHQRDN